MTTKNRTRPLRGKPAAGWRIATGLVAAAAAIGVGHGVAGLLDPVASPLVAVGAVLIDGAPTPLKTFAVRTLGTADKPVLLGGIAVALAVLAGLLGVLAWRRRPLALIGIGLLGVAGAAAALTRGTLVDALPSVAAGLAGVAALVWLTRLGTDRAPQAAAHSGWSRRELLTGLGATGLVAAVGGLGGVLAGRARSASASAAGRAVRLPAPVSTAAPLPAAAQLPGMTPFLTSANDFYRVDIALVTPRIDVADGR